MRERWTPEVGDILTESNNCHPSVYLEVQAEEKHKEGEQERGEGRGQVFEN